MNRLSEIILGHRKTIIAVFLIITAICTVMIFSVKVNYNMTDYLPESAQSTKAIAIMEDEFNESASSASVMVRNVGITEALEYKDKIKALDGVRGVVWLDDTVDLKKPIETYDESLVDNFYKNGNALFTVTVVSEKETQAVQEIRDLIGEDNAISGDAADNYSMKSALTKEVTTAIIILVPLIILILVLSTTSWIEPILFLAAIGVSVLVNMGTNLMFGQVSFVTFSVSPILQLAVSLDYAIFLLHAFGDFRHEGLSVKEAMRKAMKRSVSTVSASATTTLFGFAALVFMQFGIGADLGLSLMKGILLSFLSCVIFLPALTMSSYKLIDKTQHRPLMPTFRGAWRYLSKLAIPFTVIVVLIAVPSYLGQGKSVFSYQNSDKNPESRTAIDKKAIHDEFGESLVMAVFVPKGDVAREDELTQALERVEHVISVVSYTNQVGTGIPAEWLEPEITEQFYSDTYARIIVYTNTEAEGTTAFANVEAIHDTIGEFYDEFYTAGQSANLYDMKNVVTKDNLRVNLIAVIAIFLVLLITFKSMTLPFILLATIEVGIWFNLAIPYFTDTPINFLGYLVVSTVQLGATVDYAILLTSYYMENRRKMPQKKAVKTSIGQTFRSTLVSAATLSVAGFTLAMTSSNPAVTEIGILLGRGAVFSFVLVNLMLPILLTVFDKPIGKTTYKSRFFKRDGTQHQQLSPVSEGAKL